MSFETEDTDHNGRAREARRFLLFGRVVLDGWAEPSVQLWRAFGMRVWWSMMLARQGTALLRNLQRFFYNPHRNRAVRVFYEAAQISDIRCLLVCVFRCSVATQEPAHTHT